MRRLCLAVILTLLAAASPAVAAPTITQYLNADAGSAGTAITVNIGTPAAGDLLVVWVSTGDIASISFDNAGWNALCTRTLSGAGVLETEGKYKILQSGDPEIGSATMGVTASASTRWGVIAWKAASGTWHGTTPPECATVAGPGVSTTPTAPNINPSGWDVEDSGWVAALTFTSSSTAGTMPSSPDDFTPNAATSVCSGSARKCVIGSFITKSAANVDPGDGTFNATGSQYTAMTAAIRPADNAVAGPLVNSQPLKSLVGGGLAP